MKVLIRENETTMGVEAANMIAQEIRQNPGAVLALSTGSTPVECYKELIRLYKEEALDFSGVKAFNMDEYAGLDRGHEQSFYYFMNQHLYKHVNIDPGKTFSPDGQSRDLDRAAWKFDRLMRKEGGFDLILLGIGRDGHIAFNMPDRELKLYTHVQRLSEAAIKDNSRFFQDISQVPDQAITVGIKNILDSRKIILIANGEAKSEIMGRFLSSETVNPQVPASFLKLHEDVTIIMDEGAAKKYVTKEKGGR